MVAELSFLNAVCFVGQDDDVLPVIKQAGTLELVDRGEDDAALVLGQQGAHFPGRIRRLQRGHVGVLELAIHLRNQLDAVGNEGHRRVLEQGFVHQLHRGEQHRDGLSRSLGLVDRALVLDAWCRAGRGHGWLPPPRHGGVGTILCRVGEPECLPLSSKAV